MPEIVKPLAEYAAALVEVLGICIITAFALYSAVFAALRLFRKTEVETVFHEARQRLGRGILAGLEMLVAADIIHTVAVELTLRTVGMLAIIVLIRTFLSFTLEVELTGKWPWQQKG